MVAARSRASHSSAQPNQEGECGNVALNRLLQAALNPERPGVDCVVHGDVEFRVGDKVIQTKNDYQLTYVKKAAFSKRRGRV